jgi:molybdopterin/thiamine biosynthesis adenylyltransferase
MLSDRYQRFNQLEWWDGAVASGATALVAGVGALGNEVVKNLVLMGIGRIVIIDTDIVEAANIARAVLFREDDVGQAKVEVARKAAHKINPDCDVIALHGDIRHYVGPGLARRTTAVLGCVDNVTARVHLSNSAGEAGVPFIDGGLDIWEGTVTGFTAGEGPCYACTLTEDDLRDERLRQSCAAYAARAHAAAGRPTTPILSSIVGAVMAQEFLKIAHGIDGEGRTLLGRQLRVDLAFNRTWNLAVPKNARCELHPERAVIRTDPNISSQVTWRQIIAAASSTLQGEARSIHLPFLVARPDPCPRCGNAATDWLVCESITQLGCPKCGAARGAEAVNQIIGNELWLDRTPSEMSVPKWCLLDVVGSDSSLTTFELAEADTSLGALGR